MQNEKSKKIRVTLCVVLTLVIFLAFAARLFDWQIINGGYYAELAQSSVSYSVKSQATRGEILDVNGGELAVNVTGYNVVINKLYVDYDKINDTVAMLIRLMDTQNEKWLDILPVKYTSGGYFFTADGDGELALLQSEEMCNLSAEAQPQKYIESLAKRYSAENIADKKTQRDVISVRYNMEKTGFSNSTPYTFAENISADTVAVISEHTQSVNGVEILTTLIRTNKNPTLAPHLVGALGYITEEEYNTKLLEGKSYGYDDKIGKFGIEAAFEDTLKGKEGAKIVQKNYDGTVVSVVETVDAQPGNSIYLTIDSKYQQAANKALEENVKAARAAGKAAGGNGSGEDCEAGAAVMLSVKDFSVLACASYPNYDLEKYGKYDDYYVKLATDSASPLYNRALTGSFAPGSIFKPCVAAAALEEGAISADTKIDCTRYYDYYPSDVVACMGYHGSINLNYALKVSCNYYFAEAGRRLGIDTMYLYAEKFGLGVKTGIEVAESTGILAGRDSKNWYEGNTVQAAIGQSDNAFTPIQLATYAATIANNGTRYRTHVVDKIVNYSRDKVIMQNDKNNPEIVERVSVSQKNFDTVKKGMRSVVTDPFGTANYIFGDYKVSVAAKTGTAENSGSDHTTFICFAPYEKPEVAVAVVIEHGAKGRYSMNVAKALLDAYFEKDGKTAKS